MSAKEPPSFVTTLDLSKAPKLKQGLKEQGFAFSTPPYSVFSAKKKGISLTLYESGKLVVQGKAKKEFIEFYLEPEILEDFTYSAKQQDASLFVDTTFRMGIDESGKGDVFGPLCIAAVAAQGDEVVYLEEIGVTDSKKLTDKKATMLAGKIRKKVRFQLIRISPKKYNELYQKFPNLNHLLAWGHTACARELHAKTGCPLVISDQFAKAELLKSKFDQQNLSIELVQRTKAESDPIVAAASILARAAFLEELEKMEKKYGIHFPKGASNLVVEAGRAFVYKHGKELLHEVAKMHFKTLEKIAP